MTAKSFMQYSDAELEAIRQESLKEDEVQPRAQSAFYDDGRGCVVLELKNRVRIEIPVELIEGLAGASKAHLANIEMDAQGYALNWEDLDVQMSVEGLVTGVFGTRHWMNKLAAEFGRRGGLATTQAKKASSRANGKLGGRPRKKESVSA